MSKYVGIQFRNSGKVYDFDCGHFVLKKGDKVLVVTEEGPAVGCVCTEPQNESGESSDRKLKKVFRVATLEEIDRYERDCQLEQDVYDFCYQKVKERSVPMSIVSVEKRFDGSKTIIYFTADGRVDFRELVKDLVGRFRTRIEMRQIGVRHQAKMVGGLGTCGRPLCCSTFLNTFAPVTIKMAKKQNISLNPSKISGMCGRLMCCLTYEDKFYEQAKKKLPRIGKKVVTNEGDGKVIRQNVFKETVTVSLGSEGEIEVEAAELKELSKPKEHFFKKKKSKKRSNH
ncbi:MAG: stage 0 sporulation family protein [Deltaproteobacteria bacterium]|nr:stage 0 sporulation family protein [Deltaproteobacteria bacterium]